MTSNYAKINNLVGWIVFAIAAFTYSSTIEPTVSLWDCGEYIATAFKLEVGHPPGAPFFLLMGRLFSFFVEPTQVAMMINLLSALSSAFTILFLFWSITMLAKKIVIKNNEYSNENILAVMGAGVVGALAYTFSDTFWFSAVEGEVYAMSSLFTALVFWAALKWEEHAHESGSLKWMVLIFYLMGLSIGVHLLNLLTIPAIAFIYYFRRYEPTRKGIIITGIIGTVLLGFIQGGLIPGIVNLAAKFELLAVNTFGLPFNSGTIFYFILLIGLIVYGLYYTNKKNHPNYNAMILGFAALLVGYSSFFIIIIRSQANTPIDENNPENAISLLAYLNREQYGSQPLLYGQYFNSPLDAANPYLDGDPVYMRDDNAGKYVVSDSRKASIPNYDSRFKTIFPRMFSNQQNHPNGYKAWADIKGTPVKYSGRGEAETIMKPTFGENLYYFFRYQLGYMYFRYFMWNFVGRQNDIQGMSGNVTDGNWISGISFIDQIFLGNQSEITEQAKNNKGRNAYYFLPLILGLLGLYYQYKKSPDDSLVTFMLFIFTGVSIIIYLNNAPYQPRERDYGYVGSFYAFAIWIGLGTLFVYDFIAKKLKGNAAPIAATLICTLAVPTLMAKEGWDDHDRSNRYTARDFAKNYLDSCEPNAILFTNGDNDTFPLWYVQEVEGYRTDVRVVNLSLLQTDWYIEQMKKKAYDSESVPFSMTVDKYRQGTRDYLPIMKNDKSNDFIDVKRLVDFFSSDDPRAKVGLQNGESINYLPTQNIRVPLDSLKMIQKGYVKPEDAALMVKSIDFSLDRSYVIKNDMMVLDLLATNNWERPIYFAVTTGRDAYLNLDGYFQLDGLAYKLVPIKYSDPEGQIGRVNADKLYDLIMNKFQWGNMNAENVYLDENTLRMTLNFRNIFYRCANELFIRGEKKKALDIINKSFELMPEKNVPFDYTILPIAELLLKMGETETALKHYNRLIEIYQDEMQFHASLADKHARSIGREIEQAFQVMRQIMYHFGMHKQEPEMKKLEDKIKTLPSGRNSIYNENMQKYFAS